MRFLGNKESIVNQIVELLESKNLLNKQYTFFDAFSGTGSVANAVKGNFNIIINDKLKWCSLYSLGRIKAPIVKFEKLEIDPFSYLNENKKGLLL